MLQARLGRAVGRLRQSTAKATDERSKLMSEILSGIKMIKMYAWEAPFAAKVASVREREVLFIRRAAYLRALNGVVAFCAPVFVTLATFATYTLATGDALTATQAYVVLALFNVARFPLGLMPMATKQVRRARQPEAIWPNHLLHACPAPSLTPQR